MQTYQPSNSPEENLAILATNPYSGRFLAMGFVDGTAVQVYAIGGRSQDSRNRVLRLEDGIVSTETFDKTKLTVNPELTIYDALRRAGSAHIVSNGDQTATAIQYLRAGRSFEQAMTSRSYEPDAPNFTPRISGFIDMNSENSQPKFGLCVIRKDPGSEQAIREFYSDATPGLQLTSGVGYALHTYLSIDDPLLSFDEPPFRIPLLPTAQASAEMLWKHLDNTTLVAVAAKTIAPDGHIDFFIINTHL